MELIEKDGTSYRKVTGPARFLHNDTYLICDTALWNVAAEVIEAIGNVKILQEQTVLTSDNLTYLIPQDLAQFRGSVVQLQDKDLNTLRTKYLDYNTKDSVAVFQGGGAMKDKDGQVIESNTGVYDSKTSLFTFSDNVNMFTDSIFVKSTRMEYNTRTGMAVFGHGTNAWKEDNMLSSDAGWYDRARELFLFNDNVHGLSPDKEGWADSLFFYRNTMDVELLGHAQVTDTVNKASALAGRIAYTDSLSKVVLTRVPAIVGVTGEDGQPSDTLYFGADTLIYRTVPRCDVDSSFIAASDERLKNLATDAVMSYRAKAAEEARKAAEEAAEKDPAKVAERNAKEAAAKAAAAKSSDKPSQADAGALPTRDGTAADSSDDTERPLPEAADPLTAVDSLSAKVVSITVDSLSITRFPTDSLSAGADSLVTAVDSLPEAPGDSTKTAFVSAIGHAKLFRQDIQIVCDSLEYSDVDSLARLYKSPLIWNEEGKHQYAADSVIAVLRNGKMDKADLLSNAFIIVQEDTLCFDQIRSTEMLAYFDSTMALRRFDALGDVSAIFYLKEDSTFSTVNKSAAKMMYAQFKEGNVDVVSYFQEVKNDAYPLAQLKKDDRVIKGFNWLPDRRPLSPDDITTQKLRASQRSEYESVPRTTFAQTDIYFPGYMESVQTSIAQSREKRARQAAVRDSLAAIPAPADTLSSPVDSVASPVDSMAAPVKPSVDSTALIKDSTATPGVAKALSAKELARKEKDTKRAAAKAARDARWAQLDSLDAAKAQLKADKKAAKLRAKKLVQLKAAAAQKARDDARREKYLERYQAKAAKRKDETSETPKPDSVGEP